MLNLEIPKDMYQELESNHGKRKMGRIPSVLREEQDQSKVSDYDPKVISLGPYHRRKSELFLRDDIKHKALEIFISGSGKDKGFFYYKILEEIDEVRSCYSRLSKDEYDDEVLAEIMLLDGSFIINHMEILTNSEKLVNGLYVVGMIGFAFSSRDMFLLENQIPFRVITLLVHLRYEQEKGEDLINRYLYFAAFHGCGKPYFPRLKREEEGQGLPLHLLEAIRRTLIISPESKEQVIKKNNNGFVSIFLQCFKSRRKGQDIEANGLYPWRIEEERDTKTLVYTSRSVCDLKAKGIQFKPSPTLCLKDVKFNSSRMFHGELQLPVRFISKKTRVLFSNLIAYEVCPNNCTDYAVSSYVNLMKSPIHTEKDVKELREKRILISNLGSDDEVLKVFKEINTYGMDNAGIFHEVKEKIEEHYNNKAKTYMAELIHTYFESPWTAMALFAATLLLVLTFLQALFTIRPSHG